MKIAQLILPRYDNVGTSLMFAHGALQNELRKIFGGYTVTEGHGSWLPDRGQPAKTEAVAVYLIAMERQRGPELRDLAAHVARDARQECVMIVTPNGDVEFVKPVENKSEPVA